MYFRVSLCLVICCFLFSCLKQDQVTLSPELVSQLVDNQQSNLASNEVLEVNRGRAFLLQGKSEIYLRAEGDENWDFVLQLEELNNNSLKNFVLLNDASIVYTTGEVIIIDHLSGINFRLHLGQEILSEDFQATISKSYRGYGLIKTVGLYEKIFDGDKIDPWKSNSFEFKNNIDIVDKVSCKCKRNPPTPPSPMTPISCTAGGYGSVSCSIENSAGDECSVSCAGGFYSCCNIDD